MIPETMRAVMAFGKGDYRLMTVPTPRPKDSELLIKVEACGVCAGDIKCYEGGARFWGGDGNPAYVEPPFIPGHELLGRVVELGPGYKGELKPGDRVVSEQIVPCGHCRYCREGKYSLCEPHVVYGFKSGCNGGFAEYVVLPERSINYRVPDSLPMEQAVLIEPFACAMHAVERAQIQPGDVVVIAGAGALGLGMLSIASTLGPKALVSIEPVAWLREKAMEMGATHALEPWTRDGVEPTIASLTEGYGADVYIEATGHPSAVSQGLQLLRKGGEFVEFSVFSGPASVDWSIIGDAKELNIRGASLSPGCFPKVIEGIASGKLKTQGMLSHVLPLEQFEEAFALSKRREAIKTALVP